MADGSIIIDTKIDRSGAESGIKSLGNLASKGLGVVTKATAVMATGIAAATGAVAALTKASVEQYAEYEQLVGGVETLFKDSSDQVMQYADNAYKTAGMSANEYMNTITGFSASLLQGLGGDTAKAAEIGNQAVIDMADNANKMGTPIENIQNAYQGFAKQNYTMLDNLKLGYGGTKTEMERLLVDAQKLTGVHYDISNFSDIIQAIHAVQENLGITGTTAKEAMSTIQGSLNMTKAAWSNLLTGMADDSADFDTLIDNFVDSAGAFGENILPRIEIALNGIGQLIDKLLPVILNKTPEIISSILPGMVEAGTNIVSSLGNAILQSLPMVVNYGVQLIQNLLNGIQQSLPSIANCIIQVLSSLTTGLLEVLPQVLSIGMQAIAYLAQGIGQQLPTLIPLAIQCIMQLIQNFYDNMPLVIEAGMQLLSGLAEGIINAIPVLIEMLPQVIDSMLNYVTTSLPLISEQGCNILLALVDGIVQAIPQIIAVLPQIIESLITFFTENLPQIIDTGIQVLLALIDGLIQALPQLIAMLPQIITVINDGLLAHLPELINAGVQIIVALAKGLAQAIPQLIGAIPQIISALWNAFTSVNWADIGKNILTGIGAGIKGAITGMVEVGIQACKTLKDSVKSFFGIHSPSHVMRDEVGKMLTAGIGVGITQGLTSLLSTAKDACNKINSTFTKELNADTAQAYINTISNINGSFSTLADELEKANEAVKVANEATYEEDKWYTHYNNMAEDLADKIEELNDKKEEATSDSVKKQLEAEVKKLQKEKKFYDENAEYYKKKAQLEIDIAKESAKKQLEIAKEKEEKLKNLANATVEALKNKLENEKTITLNNITAEMDAEEERYNKKIANIDKASDKEKSKLQEKIDALEDEAEAENRLKELQEARNNIAVLQAKMDNTASEADKRAYALKIKNAQAELANKQSEWEKEDKKARLQEEIEEVEEKASAKKEALKEEYEATKESYEKQKDEVEDYYSKLLETDSLNAQTRYLLLQGNNDELVALLQSYNPLWQDAGQSLADSLLYGLNSQKQNIKDAVNEIMSLTGGSYTSKETNMATAGGYAAGTSYNPRSGLYNVDEKGFELSKGDNPIAYVSKGAGILNHMQSLQAIKEEVKAQVGTFADKLRSAVMMDQYRMSQLAFAGVNNSYGGNSYDNSSINFNVEHYHNDRQDSIEKTANELGLYARKRKKC